MRLDYIAEIFQLLRQAGYVTCLPSALHLQSAQREIALWFGPDELADYEVVAKVWIYE
jgi:hypothetical protein